MLSVAATLLLLLLSVEAQDASITEYGSNASLPITYPPKIVEGGDQVCPDTQTVRDNITSEVQELLCEASLCKGQSQQCPLTSCSDLSTDCPSGYYWVSLPSDTVAQVYCSTDRQCSCSDRAWTRVAYLDMTDPNEDCPSTEFRLITSPVRACGKPAPGCVSITFPVQGMEYNNVCGRIKAYQYYTTDGFAPYYFNREFTIDDPYVDGVSLTHGSSPREHIWTFAAAHDETSSNRWVCPCTRPDLPYTGIVPPFIEQDYFCESGSRSYEETTDEATNRLLTEDPLWNGMGCGSVSTCCSFNNPPWFCKELPQPTTDDIELRLCGNEDVANDDVPIEMFEIYVQ